MYMHTNCECGEPTCTAHIGCEIALSTLPGWWGGEIETTMLAQPSQAQPSPAQPGLAPANGTLVIHDSVRIITA